MSATTALLCLVPFLPQWHQELNGKAVTFQGRPASYWTQRLGKGSWEDQKATCLALQTLGPEGRPAVPALLRILQQRDPEVLPDAVPALCAISPDPQQILVVLRTLLADPDEKVRDAVLEGLRHPHAAEILRLLVPDLLKRLPEAEEGEARTITQVLLEAKYDSAKDTPLLLGLLQEKEPSLRRTAVQILHSQPVEAKFAPHLARLVNDVDKDVREAALQLICRYAGQAKADPQHLLPSLLDDRYGQGRFALEAIRKLGPAAKPLLPALTAALTRNTGWAKLNLARAILLLKDDTDAMTAVESACHDPDGGLHHAALQFLARRAKEDPRARAKFREIALGGQGLPAAFADSEFWGYVIDELGKEGIPILADALHHRNQELRQAALLALGRLARRHEEAVKLLVRECRPEVELSQRYEAALILAKAVDHPVAVTVLGQEVLNPELTLETRIEGLRQLGVKPTMSAAVTHYILRALRATEEELREEAVQLCLSDADPKAFNYRETVQRGLRDSSPEVRRVAAQCLGRLGPSAREMLPDLRRLLSDPEPSVQGAALLAISGIDPNLGAEQIRPLLKHPEDSIRVYAVKAATRPGPVARILLPELLRIAMDEGQAGGSRGRTLVLIAFGQLRFDDPRVLAYLIRVIDSKPQPKQRRDGRRGGRGGVRITSYAAGHPGDFFVEYLCKVAFESLRQYDRLPPDILAKLWGYVHHGHGQRRLLAASVLFHVEKSPLAFAALRNGLRDRSPYHRVSAASMLAYHGPAAKAAVPDLLQALRDSSESDASHIAAALWKLERHPEAMRYLLQQLDLRNNFDRVRYESACRVLLHLGPDAEQALPALREIVRHGHEADSKYAKAIIRIIERKE